MVVLKNTGPNGIYRLSAIAYPSREAVYEIQNMEVKMDRHEAMMLFDRLTDEQQKMVLERIRKEYADYQREIEREQE